VTLTVLLSAAAALADEDVDGGVDGGMSADPEAVRPAALIDVPPGVVLTPRDENNRRTTFRPEQEYKCFPVDQWIQLGNLITDYRWFWYYSMRLESKIALLESQIGNLEIQLVIWKDTHESTQRALLSVSGLLDKEHDARLHTAARDNLELWGWRISTVLGLVAAGAFGAAWGVERAK